MGLRPEQEVASFMRHGMAKNLSHGSRPSFCEILSMLVENCSVDSTILIRCRQTEKAVYGPLTSCLASQDHSQIDIHRARESLAFRSSLGGSALHPPGLDSDLPENGV